ncbi:baseplate J/gp47 family protein [Ereboglobus luteus]|uniref:Uncharacterized protein n=1 Tax=Ereboglobus luteus TaxID=1796921 RepID=A0A2U8E677_9BACT|nr:baseplate J/gp47 family protein [Ereboglobus luteus]AWI10320.1 hypothetical protein CKA38_14600 [Ereboglobus luteus]
MPNTINNNGIQTKPLDEIIESIVEGADGKPGLKAIYGPDINIDSDTPDGQLVNIFALAVKDVLDLAVQTYNSFDPDLAIGRSLDMRCAINGIERQGASYTETTVAITTDRAVTLHGLDNADDTPFTVSDGEGNRYVLKNTAVLSDPVDAEELDFRAEEAGAVICLADTITKQITITPGVTAVNNPNPPKITGVNEESDYSLRSRRSRALSLPAVGTVDGILSSILDVKDVTEAIVYENTSNIEEGGIPAHSIWCIVEGGKKEDIAQAIYMKRNAGCGMKGETKGIIKQENGIEFNVCFDRPIEQPLWIRFNTITIDGGRIASKDYLRNQLVEKLRYSIHQNADITTIAKLAREIVPDVVICDAEVSADNDRPINEKAFHAYVEPESRSHRFVVGKNRIIIDGVVGSDDSGEIDPEDDPDNENENG